MTRVLRNASSLVFIVGLVACQGGGTASDAAPSPTETTDGQVQPTTTVEESSAPASPSPSAIPTEAARAQPVDRAVVEAGLTALNCEFVNEFNQGPIWSCPGADYDYVVSLLTDATGAIGDVLIVPDSALVDGASTTPEDEVGALAVGILEVLAPSAASAELESATSAIDSFAGGDPTTIEVAGWTLFLAESDNSAGDSWTLGMSNS
jgi:hypothetical protein